MMGKEKFRNVYGLYIYDGYVCQKIHPSNIESAEIVEEFGDHCGHFSVNSKGYIYGETIGGVVALAITTETPSDL